MKIFQGVFLLRFFFSFLLVSSWHIKGVVSDGDGLQIQKFVLYPVLLYRFFFSVSEFFRFLLQTVSSLFLLMVRRGLNLSLCIEVCGPVTLTRLEEGEGTSEMVGQEVVEE